MSNIQFEYNLENITSRIPALFPYIENNELGISELHHSTDSVDGCYGKIVPNMKLPLTIDINGNSYSVKLDVETTDINDNGIEINVIKNYIYPGTTYTYNYLMYCYYKFYNIRNNTNINGDGFFAFIERAIGKKTVDINLLGLTDTKKYNLVPEYIYLSEVPELYNEYFKMKKVCDAYNENFENTKNKDLELCCMCNKYIAMGGDIMLYYIEDFISESEFISNEYYKYAKNSDFELTINYNIPLFQSKNDIGYLSSYINEWIPGEHYYCGDIVTYNGITWICVLNEVLSDFCHQEEISNNLYDYVRCNDKYYLLDRDNNKYNEIKVKHLSIKPEYNLCLTDNDEQDSWNFIEVSGVYYKWNSNTNQYDIVNMHEYTSGYWNDDTLSITFDYAHFMPITGYNIIYGIPNVPHNQWYSSDNPYGTKFKIFNEISELVIGDEWETTYISDNIKKGNKYYAWNYDNGRYIIDDDKCNYYVIKGKSDSKLKGLRRFRRYIHNENSNAISESNEDCLFYYKEGYIAEYTLMKDEFGNIKKQTNTQVNIGEYDYNMYAYGNVIKSIDIVPDERKLTFTYIIGAHLKAKLIRINIDDNNNFMYYYDKFEIDENSKKGVEFTEDYTYSEESQITQLVQDGTFNEYVKNFDDIFYLYHGDTDIFLYINVNMSGLTKHEFENISQVNEKLEFAIFYGKSTNEDDARTHIFKWENSSYIELSINNFEIFDYNGYIFDFDITDSKIETEVLINDKKITYSYIESDFNSSIDNNLEYLYAPVFKKDYLMNVTYDPRVNIDVNIDRGNAAARERHIKLGEVKTVEDIENYSNGGFFNVKN